MRNDERLRTIYEVMAPYIVRNEHNWRDYLAFASQFHKHSFDNILLVYAQDEDVSILATRKQWAAILSPRDAYRLMLKDYPDVMDIGQMCEALGVSTKTGYKLLKDGKIEYLKIGRAYRIPKAHILRYLKITCSTFAE